MNPIIAMKCMTQMPVPPRATAASTSHQIRCRPAVNLSAREVQISPSKDPKTDRE
ncbi:hypothetical protein Vau01_066210 [Virgisporangium aurantiacum]|uniref:Uncharacterized protein n=1 Tax=Virgisporangium aurantiacum TaxID=175570 RepID=A0A8J3ZCD5_9ACTN|nr:hypothetical protein Vau01_066210 [Virgisporangium aurantiacum]